jgi:hypothetical protein
MTLTLRKDNNDDNNNRYYYYYYYYYNVSHSFVVWTITIFDSLLIQLIQFILATTTKNSRKTNRESLSHQPPRNLQFSFVFCWCWWV